MYVVSFYILRKKNSKKQLNFFFSTLNTKIGFLAVALPNTQQPLTVPVSVSGSVPAMQYTVYSCTWENFRLPVSAPPLMSSDLDR